MVLWVFQMVSERCQMISGNKWGGGFFSANGACSGCCTEGRASDLFQTLSLSKVLGNIISEPEHKPLAWSRQTSSLSTSLNKFPSLTPSLIFVLYSYSKFTFSTGIFKERKKHWRVSLFKNSKILQKILLNIASVILVHMSFNTSSRKTKYINSIYLFLRPMTWNYPYTCLLK